MHTLLSVQEAFAAKQAGKNVVCRHAESEFFEDLGNVSAETWFDPHYVFAIQIDTITLGDFEFAKPFTLEELSPGQDIFYIGASGTILKGTFNPDNEMLVSGVNNGSVQRDEENAVIQIKAFRSLLGITSDEPTVVDYDFFVVDGESPKTETKKRGGRKKKDTETTVVESEQQAPEHEPLDESDTNVRKTIDAINLAQNLAELDFIESELNSSPRKYVQDELNQFKDLITQRRQDLDNFSAENAIASITARLEQATTIADLNDLELEVKNQRIVTPQVTDSCNQLLIDIEAKREELNQIDLDLLNDDANTVGGDTKVGVVNTFKKQIDESKSESDLQKVKVDIGKFWSLNADDKHYLDHLIECKKNELSASKPPVTEYKKLQEDAVQFLQYQEKLNYLINLVQQAQSVDEANDPASQTLDWTVEQRLPLITAISKRLVELGKPLVTQIREASDLNTLDAYLAQIKEMVAVDGTLAHQLMITHVAKKAELEKQVAT